MIEKTPDVNTGLCAVHTPTYTYVLTHAPIYLGTHTYAEEE